MLPGSQGLQPLEGGLQGETWTKGLDTLLASAKEYAAAGEARSRARHRPLQGSAALGWSAQRLASETPPETCRPASTSRARVAGWWQALAAREARTGWVCRGVRACCCAGATFAKWRATIKVQPGGPSDAAVARNAQELASYAALAQVRGKEGCAPTRCLRPGPV